MKKFLMIIICIISVFAFSACSNNAPANLSKNLQNSTSFLQNSVLKLKTANQSELASLTISPKISDPTQKSVAYETKTTNSVDRINFNSYITKLDEVYNLNIDILERNAEINSLRQILSSKISEVQKLSSQIKDGRISITDKLNEGINTCIRAIRRSAENIDNKNAYFNNARDKFKTIDLNKPDEAIIRSKMLMAEMDSVTVDLNFAVGTLDTTINIINQETKPVFVAKKTLKPKVLYSSNPLKPIML